MTDSSFRSETWSYILQFVQFGLVLAVAILIAYFKVVKEKNGKHRYKFGLPVPTKTGILLLLALFGSFVVSLTITRQGLKTSRTNEIQAKEAQRNLEDQLSLLRTENSGLKNSLEQTRESNLQGFKSVLAEQTKKHSENLDRFSGLLSQQERSAQRAAEGFNRMLTPIRPDFELTFWIEIPVSQKTVEYYVRRLEARQRGSTVEISPADSSFPNKDDSNEVALFNLLSILEIRVEFVSGPIDTREFTKVPPQPLLFGLQVGREMELLPMKKSVGDYLKFGAEARLSQATEGEGSPTVILQYLRRLNVIIVQVYGIKPTDVEHTLNISSFVDLPGRNVAVYFVRGSFGTNFYLDYLAVRTQAGELEIDKFSRYYLRQKPVFVAAVPKGRSRTR